MESDVQFTISDYTVQKYDIREMVRKVFINYPELRVKGASWICNDVIGVVDISFEY